MSMKTQVCFTVDTEFSIGGAFQKPEHYKPVGQESVWCITEGKSNGLGFIVETLDQFDFKGTFFVEALNVHYFGYDEMGDIARTIDGAGHDVQLHLHPCWTYFSNENWVDALKNNSPNDSMTERSADEQYDLIQFGMNVFKKWGLQLPIALRTGNLHANTDLYAAMHKANIPYGSNIGVGVHRTADSRLHWYHGSHEINRVIETPVLSYRDLDIAGISHDKSLTIIGSTLAEIKILLRMAHDMKIGQVIILTHPSEFISLEDEQYKHFSPNKTTQSRLYQLCQYLDRARDHFEVVTFKQGSQTWKDDGAKPIIVVPIWCLAQRMLGKWLPVIN